MSLGKIASDIKGYLPLQILDQSWRMNLIYMDSVYTKLFCGNNYAKLDFNN